MSGEDSTTEDHPQMPGEIKPGGGTQTVTPEQPDKSSQGGTADLPAAGTIITDDNTDTSYEIVEEGKTVVYKKVLNVNVKKVVIPNVVNLNGNTYNVINISNNAFNKCTKLTSITISNNVTIIGSKAFNKCKSLKKIVIPAGVKSIGKNAFAGCKSLKKITIKSKVLKTVGKKRI